jgi:acetyl-CoA C-acetyltransferase
LAYHGGPASGYLTHSIAAMVGRLRADAGALGLVSGVGMQMTKHVFGVYSTEPGALTPPEPVRAPAKVQVAASYDGPATVAAYSVVHERDGAPSRALLVCDLPDGVRTYATVTDADTCRGAEQEELVGTPVSLRSIVVDGALGPATVNRATVCD